MYSILINIDIDGLSDGEEVKLEIKYSPDGNYATVVGHLVSDPTSEDGDDDDILDVDDERPLSNDIEIISLKSDYIHIFDYPDGIIETYTDETNYGESYGGNQDWFYYGENSWLNKIFNEDCKIMNYGCGLIAITDTILYLRLKNENLTNTDLKNSMINSGDINSDGAVRFSKYSEFVHNYNSNYNVLPLLGFNGISMASFFDGYSLGGNMGLYSYWGKGFLSINDITSMIQNDFPVIMSVGPSYTNDHCVTLYSALRLSNKNIKDKEETTTYGHYMTITGVIFDRYNDKTWLKVSSWGSCYYIDFDEYYLFAMHNFGASGVMNNILHIVQL